MSLNQFEAFITQLQTESIFVIDPSFSKTDYVLLDLSKNNEALKTVNVSSSHNLGVYIDQHIKNKNGKVAYGGYLETRGIYQRSGYFNAKANPLDERNIHLGIDIWIDEGTNVLAALDGEIHSFNNNVNHGDYGPTIILKHEVGDLIFYTLYGHLSIASLSGLKVGQNIKQGAVIGKLGSPKENGDYSPHLHFQVILDIEKYLGDYPGVSSINRLGFYKNNCPNPNFILGLKG